MPGAELRRQKREFWRGAIRTASAAVIIILLIGNQLSCTETKNITITGQKKISYYIWV